MKHSSDRLSNPSWITTKNLIISSRSQMSYQSKLHHKMINHFLSIRFSNFPCLKIFFNINIKEWRNISKRHRSTILLLYTSKIRKICPLNSLLSCFCRSCNIKTISLSHLHNIFQSSDLHWYFLSKSHLSISHISRDSLKVSFFLLYQSISSIQS